MRLVRNTQTNGNGKYAVIKLEMLGSRPQTPHELAAAILANPDAVCFGKVGDRDEFFVMMVKDRDAEGGLLRYAKEASKHDAEYAKEILELAARAGTNSPFCKLPD